MKITNNFREPCDALDILVCSTEEGFRTGTLSTTTSTVAETGRSYQPLGLFERLEDRTLLAAPHPLELSSLLQANGGNGSVGFAINGQKAGDNLGRSVSAVGDFNGDGFDDVLVGGEVAYVLFGGPSQLQALDVADPGGKDGRVDVALLTGERSRSPGRRARTTLDPERHEKSLEQPTRPETVINCPPAPVQRVVRPVGGLG